MVKFYKCGSDKCKKHCSQVEADKCRRRTRNIKERKNRVQSKKTYANEPFKMQLTLTSYLSNFLIDRELALLSSTNTSSIQILQHTGFKINKIQKNISVTPILEKDHWYFVLWNKKKRELTIYDSLRGYSDYAGLYKTFGFHILHINHTFPQQNNAYDCGVIVILGIQQLIKMHQNKVLKEWTWDINSEKNLTWRQNKMKDPSYSL